MPAKGPLLPLDREISLAALAGRLASRFTDSKVEPEEIAREAGIAFRYAPFPEDFDGVLMHQAGRFFIVCNDRVHPRGSGRSRFTFAHELGHFFIPEHRAALEQGQPHFSRTEFTSNSPFEREADHFAASLLLPEPLVRRVTATAPGSLLRRVERAADFLGASLTATAFRALQLDFLPAPSAVFRWDALGCLASRRLSPTTARLRREYLGLAKAPAAETVTHAAIANLAVGHRSGPSHVMNWFPKLTGYDGGDQDMLTEEVISLGSYGWLTIVHAAG